MDQGHQHSFRSRLNLRQYIPWIWLQTPGNGLFDKTGQTNERGGVWVLHSGQAPRPGQGYVQRNHAQIHSILRPGCACPRSPLPPGLLVRQRVRLQQQSLSSKHQHPALHCGKYSQDSIRAPHPGHQSQSADSLPPKNKIGKTGCCQNFHHDWQSARHQI